MEEILRARRQEILKTRLTTNLGFAIKHVKPHLHLSWCLQYYPFNDSKSLGVGQTCGKELLQPFPLTFSLCLPLEPSFHYIFHFQSFQIANLFYWVVGAYHDFFFFRKKAVSTRNAYLGLMGVQGSERLMGGEGDTPHWSWLLYRKHHRNSAGGKREQGKM